MFTWDKLLSDKTEKGRTNKGQNDSRTPFQDDYSRIIFSTPFRRLQDKAQVFPLEENDFVRTRLTHSLEVAAISKSIGISIQAKLIAQKKLEESKRGMIPDVLECAGLAHDLGNPPFGHFGEVTLQKKFDDLFNTENDLSEVEKKDFTKFDGNCQTIRILTRLQCIKDLYGYHMTYATLATLMKYPMNSKEGNVKDGNVWHKKFGYFQSEKNIAENILKETGLYIKDGKAYRHPLAFILEAADDIAYSAADIEDGFKKKAITFKDIKDVFTLKQTELKSNVIELEKERIIEIDNVLEDISRLEKEKLYLSDEKRIQMLRILLQGKMISSVVNTFLENYDSIMNGNFVNEILLESKSKYVRLCLKEIANKYILSNDEVQKTELAGESIIDFLVDYFLKALASKEFQNYIKLKCSNKDNNKKAKIDGRIDRVYNLISSDYRKIFEVCVEKSINEQNESQILYYTYLLVTDFISCMTDNYSVSLYRKLKGITIN